MQSVIRQLRSIFGNTESVGQARFRELNATRPVADRTRICHAPFRSIRFEQRGSVRTCCFNTEVVLGRYPEKALSEIWNSEEANTLRDQIMNNELGGGCHRCEKQLLNKEFDTVKLKQYDGLPDNQHGYPTILDFSIHNTCNLECIMCHGEFSSSIRMNREGLPPVPMVYDDRFVEQLEEFIPHASRFVFAGGEPFLIGLYYNIWERINRLNPTDVHIVTNGTVLNNRVKGILENGRYHITHSIESLEKGNYARIRKNAGLDQVLENMRYFIDYCNATGTEYAINICPLQQNWRELPEFVEFCNQRNLKLYILSVVYPPNASLMALSADELEEVESYYDQFEFDVSTPVMAHNAANFNDLLLRVRGWKKRAIQNASLSDGASASNADALEISVLFDMAIEKMDLFLKQNPEMDTGQVAETKRRILRFASLYQDKRITKGKFKEIDNMPAEAIIGAMGSASDEEFGLIMRDHILD